MDSRAARLARLGQSIWYDNVSRDLLDSGELARLVAEHGVRGVTSNPTIFQKAMSSAKAYQAQFEALAGRGATADAIYEACAVEDIRRGADILRGVHDASGGTDGFISLEVSPRLAADTAATIAEAKRLHAAVGRPNLMIKVPATPEGIPAVRALIAAGISVNVTLIFSVGAYADVVEAYLSGLEERVAAGLSVAHIASVASFFVSRVDTAIDAALDAKAKAEPARAAEIRALRGRAAIANAQLAYELFEQRFAGDRWDRLAARGAQLQRPLWASTSTKNPEYRDTIYVDALIGAHTVNTVPPATLTALNDHGHVGLTIHDGMQGARGLLAQLEAEGISIGAVCADLLRAGVASFAQSFDDLLGAVEKRRAAAPASAGGAFGHDRVAQLRLGALEGLFARDALRRIWARDGALFGTNAEARASASNRLGWLAAHEAMRLRLPEIREFADGVRADGLTDVILCGMGGSSLCAEVLRDVLGAQPGGLRLQVLDSTDPEAIRLAESSCDLAKTLIVVASKSGSTVETDCLMRHFLERHRAAGRAGAGRFFTAITDPGSSLVATAEKLHFRAIFENPQDIGGRYSALSLFGLVPAALLGADLDAILASAAAAAHRNGPDADPVNASGLQLGAVIGALALAGADKLTLRTSPRLSSFGAWAEQLIAESTGKQGKGVLPVVDEPAGCPQGSDRTCVDLALVGDAGPPAGPRPEAVVVAGSASDLGALFWQFEMATAVSGVVLGVNPFDEPNVAEAKAATNAVLAGTGEAVPLAVGRAPHFDLHMPRALGGKCPQELFAEAAAGDYVAILAYVARTPHRHELLQSMRAAVAKSSKLATTLGYGPRYLHSTGQLHKGGAGNGIFLLVTVDPDPSSDLPVPGRAHSFGTLFAAQAEGDFRTLVAHGRRVVELRLRRPVDASLAALVAAFA